MTTERISVYLDNNVWDFLFVRRLNLAEELPKDEFCVCITREAEFEIPPIPDCKADLKAFIQATIEGCLVTTDIFFGFHNPDLPDDEQRVGGFGHGRWARSEELEFLAQQQTRIGGKNPKTKLFKKEADISIAARAFTGVVLSLDAKAGPINDAYKAGGRVVFLTDFDKSGLTLRDFIKASVAATGPGP